MLDPFTAISLASSIVAFVDFSIKLVSLGNEIRQSSEGSSTASLDLQLLGENLSTVSSNLATTSSNVPATINPDLHKICHRCQDLANEIATTVNKLKSHGSKKRWASYVQAMKEIGAKSRLKNIAETLQQLQTALILNLVAYSSKNQSAMTDSITSLTKQLNEYQVTDQRRIRQIEVLQNEVLNTLSSIRADSLLTHTRVNTHLNSVAKLKPLHYEDVRSMSSALSSLEAQLKDLAAQGRIVTREQVILKRLYFERLRARRENIPDAHNATLGWVFEPHPPDWYTGAPINFTSWLQNGDGLYWIRGKPGSGKSTLMKYLYSHTKTLEALNQWAKPKPVIVASYFFWSGGTDLQKSQHGLLQSLLFEICRQNPTLIGEIFEYSIEMEYGNFEWSFVDLQDAFEKLTQVERVSTRFCFFIDGLDEYNTRFDSNKTGEPFAALIAIVKNLASLPNVKLCVASRAENAFIEAFSNSASGQLALENLNRQDVRNLVQGDLADDPRFIAVQKTEPRYSTFVDTICERANGVFLWAVLVVRTLQEAIFTDHESFDTVERLLHALPSDLRAFFMQIVDRISDDRKHKTAEAFQVMLAAPQPPRLSTFSFLDDYHTSLAFENFPRVTNDRLLSAEMNTLQRRINGRCKLLITVTGMDIVRKNFLEQYHHVRVEFLHRTVRDFLQNEDLSTLFNILPSPNDADIRLAESVLYHLKRSPPALINGDDMKAAEVESLLELLAYHAREVEERTDKSMDRLLDEVVAFQKRSFYSQQQSLSYFLQRGLAIYPANKLNDSEIASKVNLNKLLFDIINLPSEPGLKPFLSPRTVKILLERGADPNSKPGENSTVWFLWMKRLLRRNELNHNNHVSFEVTKLLIKHGAYCNEIIEWNKASMLPRSTGRATDKRKVKEKSIPVYARQIVTQLDIFTIIQKDDLRKAIADQESSTIWKRMNYAMRVTKTNLDYFWFV